MSEQDYRQTLNLPKVTPCAGDFPRKGFPQKADLPILEPKTLEWWKSHRIYQKLQEKNRGKPKFILHDGPPYSNGDIHLGHALNKILKDLVVKFKAMSGFDSPYVPGWDNHGLPTERLVIEKWLEDGKLQPGVPLTHEQKLELRQSCRELAEHYSKLQSEQFQRLGVFGDWENPYLTMDPVFEAKEIEAFGELALKGYVYRGLRSVYWCKNCVTALADAEIEYANHESPSMWVRFPLLEDPVGAFQLGNWEIGELGNCYALIWTTTPWTIPGNMAICLHPEFDYVIVEVENPKSQIPNPKSDYYLLAEGLLPVTAEALGWSNYQVRKRFVGNQLRGVVFKHPFYERPSPIIFGEHVTLEQGTGCVHTAPGHGPEDFEVCQREGISVISPVDEFGRFTDEAGERLKGVDVDEGNQLVIEWLQEVGCLMKAESVVHSYPHCWRCKEPVLFRATVQWFMNIDHDRHRQRCLDAIQKVQWVPPETINRITAMVEARPDWCLSRQRAWGVGLPIFYCQSCGKEVITKESLQAVADLVRREGSDAWFLKEAHEILPAGFSCPHCATSDTVGGASCPAAAQDAPPTQSVFKKEEDILDVWFDSGCSHLAVLETRPELRWPCDIYLEGPDQHRGWFNTSLMVAVGVKGEAPYRIVFTNGWVVDEEGRAMHKSLGNVITPFEIIEQNGADVLRLWVCASSYEASARMGKKILDWLVEVYKRFRFTLRYLLGNLYDFNPDTDRVPYEQMLELDRYILHRLQKVIAQVRAHFEAFEFHRAYQLLYSFCDGELSAFYLDVIKDRLYCSLPNSPERRSAQTALFELCSALCRMLFPMISHTAEEAWQHLPAWKGKPESVALADFPDKNEAWVNDELERKWERLLAVREEVNRALEQAKKEGRVKNPLEACVQIFAPSELSDFLRKVETPLQVVFNVSETQVLTDCAPPNATPAVEIPKLFVKVELNAGQKCARCWMRLPSVGQDSEHPTLCKRCADVVRQLRA